jgi:4-amino-4-deoxy-L-arabinose transferase-like glycosyltransferase
MAVGGSWTVPQRDGMPYLEKPPLMMWAAALSIGFFGANAWAARLPSALAAVGGVVALYGLVRVFADQSAALFANLCLATSFGYFI